MENYYTINYSLFIINDVLNNFISKYGGSTCLGTRAPIWNGASRIRRTRCLHAEESRSPVLHCLHVILPSACAAPRRFLLPKAPADASPHRTGYKNFPFSPPVPPIGPITLPSCLLALSTPNEIHHPRPL
jgi:hypothetical protein